MSSRRVRYRHKRHLCWSTIAIAIEYGGVAVVQSENHLYDVYWKFQYSSFYKVKKLLSLGNILSGERMKLSQRVQFALTFVVLIERYSNRARTLYCR